MKKELYDNDTNCCVLLCTCFVFRIDYELVYELFKMVGRRRGDGCTTLQCKKVFNILCMINDEKVTYHRSRSTLKGFVENHKTGTYLINQRAHMSCLKDGILIDTYITSDTPFLNDYVMNDDSDFEIVGYWKHEKN